MDQHDELNEMVDSGMAYSDNTANTAVQADLTSLQVKHKYEGDDYLIYCYNNK